MRIAVADIGGTHARFALADVDGGTVVSLGEPIVLRAREHSGLASAWRAFARTTREPLPRLASFGLAGPVTGGPVRFINTDWVVDPATLAEDLELDAFLVLNDFGAMAHAVHALPPDQLVPLCGPDVRLPEGGAISVIGAGTGLGVAVLIRRTSGVTVLETEGAHIHFAPLSKIEVRIAADLSALYGRTSVERVVSGPGLGAIVRSLAPNDARDDPTLWQAAADSSDPVAAEALGLWLDCYGAAVGDLSLAHGSLGVALTGGLTNRVRRQLPHSGFHARFCDKGRYRARMETIPVKLVTHPQPGLYGAAFAFALEHGR